MKLQINIIVVCVIVLSFAGISDARRKPRPIPQAPADLFPAMDLPPFLAQEPAVLFAGTDSIKVSWTSFQEELSVLHLGSAPDKLKAVYQKKGTKHTVIVRNINTVDYFKISTGNKTTKTYKLDKSCNYHPNTIAPAKKPDPAAQSKAKKYLDLITNQYSGRWSSSGYCVIIDANPETIVELARQSCLTIAGLYTDPARSSTARQAAYKAGAYGNRILIYDISRLTTLPFRTNFANIVIHTGKADQLQAELARIVQPGGFLLRSSGSSVPPLFKKLAGSELSLCRKSCLNNIGAWTHQYGTAANTTSSAETLGGVRDTNMLGIQWLGRPGADFGVDRNPRMPAPLAVDGRLFHQGRGRVIALDQYNGAVLWNLEIPNLFRFNVPRDCGNWATATGQALYLAVRNQLWKIEPKTGEVLHSLQLPDEKTRTKQIWGYVACLEKMIIGSSVDLKNTYTGWWGLNNWYDKISGYTTRKVTSNNIFACSHQGKLLWSVSDMNIVNSTIAIDNNRVYFLDQNPAGPLELVALDAGSGKEVLRKSTDIPANNVVCYGQVSKEGVILTFSEGHKYTVRLFDSKTGLKKWETGHSWPGKDHSAHMQHPVLLKGVLYLEPKRYTLADGKLIPGDIGKREGCHTYLGMDGALIYRGTGRIISMWNTETGQVTAWSALRPSCWLSFIPAGGMLLVPDGGGGCSCGKWLDTSMGFAPWAKSGDKK